MPRVLRLVIGLTLFTLAVALGGSCKCSHEAASVPPPLPAAFHALYPTSARPSTTLAGKSWALP